MVSNWHAVLICDGVPDSSGEVLDINGMTFDEVAPLYCNFDHHSGPIGKVILRKEDNMLLAKIDTSFAYNGLFPCIDGTTTGRNGNKITEFKVNSISLCSAGNADPRIKPIELKNEVK